MEHVLVRRLEHLTGSASAPRLAFAVEVRERPGPAHKNGAFPGDDFWVQLHGGLFVAKAKVRIAWVGEYSNIREIRRRTAGSPVHDVDDFWARRPKFGYAAVAELQNERWIEPFWAGPRTYGYEWIILDDEKKRSSWLEKKSPPSGGQALEKALASFKAERGG